MADKYRHLTFNKGCPVVLVILVVQGDIEMVTKLLILKSNCYVYAFFVGGVWKCFKDCPYTLVVNDDNVCAEELPFYSNYMNDSYGEVSAVNIHTYIQECHYGNDGFRGKLLKLIVAFVEAAKFSRIYHLVCKVLCATHDRSPMVVSLPRRDFLLFNYWGQLSKALYILISKGKWNLPAAIVKNLQLPFDQDEQIKKCLNSVLIINRPSLTLGRSDFNFQKIDFTVNLDYINERHLLVAQYNHVVDRIRSMTDGGITVLDITRPFVLKIKVIDGGSVVSKCSLLVSRENFEFCCVKLCGKWYSFFQSPYTVLNEAKKEIKRLDSFSIDFKRVRQFSIGLLKSLHEMQLGNGSLMHGCSVLYFIFCGGSIFHEIQAFMRSVFLECPATFTVPLNAYHIKLLRFWPELSYFLRNVKEKKQKEEEFHLRRKVSNELNLPRFTENEEAEVRRRVAIIHC